MFYPESSIENPPGTPETVLFKGLRFKGYACQDCHLAWFEADEASSAAGD
jgi:hypothetical protein